MSPRVTYYILVLGHNQLLTLKTLSYINHIYLDLSKLGIDMFEKLYYNPEKELDSEEDYEL